ncbi:hypothetical protein [Hymenobacter pini]|uniref:hypothetical protein n=1 Tax=Hymenobacter pini TaxID=2880879 RepID=UPI001CF3FCF0|nr:hypothetical protein [Hymenobacter pini]MCA8829432.1 hypothetical protein [Hymenobacter pini]
MAVILTFELEYRQAEIRQLLIEESGFQDSFFGFHTQTGEPIITNLPQNVLYHPDYDMQEAMASIRNKAHSYTVDIDYPRNVVAAFDVAGNGLTGWRGTISKIIEE